jgi:hypothetical protein
LHRRPSHHLVSALLAGDRVERRRQEVLDLQPRASVDLLFLCVEEVHRAGQPRWRPVLGDLLDNVLDVGAAVLLHLGVAIETLELRGLPGKIVGPAERQHDTRIGIELHVIRCRGRGDRRSVAGRRGGINRRRRVPRYPLLRRVPRSLGVGDIGQFTTFFVDQLSGIGIAGLLASLATIVVNLLLERRQGHLGILAAQGVELLLRVRDPVGVPRMHFVRVGVVVLPGLHRGDVEALVIGVLDALPKLIQATPDRGTEHVRIGMDVLLRAGATLRRHFRIGFVVERVACHDRRLARPGHWAVRSNCLRASRARINQRHQRIHHNQCAGSEFSRLDPPGSDLFVHLRPTKAGRSARFRDRAAKTLSEGNC